MTSVTTRRPQSSLARRRALLALNAIGAGASLGFSVRGVRHPSCVQPAQTTSPLASFWASSSAVRTWAIAAPLLGSMLLRERAAPELLVVAGLVQFGDSALGLWQRKADMTLAPALLGSVHLVSARWLSR